MPNALIELKTGDKKNPEMLFSIESSGDLVRVGDLLIDTLRDEVNENKECSPEDWREVFTSILPNFLCEGAILRAKEDNFKADLNLVIEASNDNTFWKIDSFMPSNSYCLSGEEKAWIKENL